jgi:hypothetical protein
MELSAVCQPQLALALLVLCVFADHPDHTVARDDLALDANLFDRCSDFHNCYDPSFIAANFAAPKTPARQT